MNIRNRIYTNLLIMTERLKDKLYNPISSINSYVRVKTRDKYISLNSKAREKMAEHFKKLPKTIDPKVEKFMAKTENEDFLGQLSGYNKTACLTKNMSETNITQLITKLVAKFKKQLGSIKPLIRNLSMILQKRIKGKLIANDCAAIMNEEFRARNSYIRPKKSAFSIPAMANNTIKQDSQNNNLGPNK